MSGESDSTKPPRRPAIIYTRFSPKPKFRDSLDSADVQESICRRYCEFNGLDVVKVYSDPLISARATELEERPSGPDVIADLGARRVAMDIVCVRLDRIFRNVDDGRRWMRRWFEDGVRLHLSDQGGCTINCGTPTGILIATNLLAITEYEPAVTADRTRASMLHKQSHGRVMTRHDRVPWGFEVDTCSELNERGFHSAMRECDYERQASHYAASLFAQGVPIRRIVSLLGENYPSPRGKSWNARRARLAAKAKWED